MEVTTVDEGNQQGSVAEPQGNENIQRPTPADAGANRASPTTDSPRAMAQASEDVERLRGELKDIRSQLLDAHRRALLAENRGNLVPELVKGSTLEELERSVQTSCDAYAAAKAAVLAELSSVAVPVGNPVRQEPSIEHMTPLEKISLGLNNAPRQWQQ